MSAINTNDMGKDQKELLAFLKAEYPRCDWRIDGSMIGIKGWLVYAFVPWTDSPTDVRATMWIYDPITETKPDLLAKLKASLDE